MARISALRMTSIDSDLFDRAIAAEERRKRNTRAWAFAFGVLLLSPFAYVVAQMQGIDMPRRLIVSVGYAGGVVVAALVVVGGLQWLASRAMMSFMQPGGRSRGAALHSKAEALAASGRLQEASAEFEATRAVGGETIASLRAEAELHAMASGDPKRAEDLFLRIRRSPLATRSDELYASHRLIDLYLGPLDDAGRVMVELRRMAERFPNTPDGEGARAELNRRRDEAASAA